MEKKSRPLSARVYAALLAAYPPEFRREYGREMAIVFADRCRDEARRGRAYGFRVWRDALGDLARTAATEHLERLRRGGGRMKVLRTIALALVAYSFTLLVVAPLYARNAALMPGFIASLLDALISTGLLFNFIFLVLTLTRLTEGARAVRATLVVTCVVVAALIAIVRGTAGPHAGVGVSIILAQALSLFVWFSVHLWWVLRRKATGPQAVA